MVKKGEYTPEEEVGILFDLRAFRARLIAQIIEDIYDTKKERKYSDWFRNLLILYNTIEHMTGKELDNFDELKKETIQIINKYKSVFFRQNFDAAGVTELEDAFFKVERTLLRAMNKRGVFGMKEDVRGL